MKIFARSKRNKLLLNSQSLLDQCFGPLDYRPVETLKAYANNPRRHDERQITSLMASIIEFGFAMPMLVDGDGVIIAGEARVTAAKRLGMPQVPVLIADHWSLAQVRAYRLADNRLAEHATWNEEMLHVEIANVIEFGEVSVEILGWSTAKIDILLNGSDPDG